MYLNFGLVEMRKALSGEGHKMPEELTRNQFKEWMAGRLKIVNEGLNINPKLAFNPLPPVPPKAPPSVPDK